MKTALFRNDMTVQRFDELPDVLTVAEASGVLRLSRNATYEAIQRGEVPAVRIGRRLLVPKAGLVRMLDALQSRAPAYLPAETGTR